MITQKITAELTPEIELSAQFHFNFSSSFAKDGKQGISNPKQGLIFRTVMECCEAQLNLTLRTRVRLVIQND